LGLHGLKNLEAKTQLNQLMTNIAQIMEQDNYYCCHDVVWHS